MSLEVITTVVFETEQEPKLLLLKSQSGKSYYKHYPAHHTVGLEGKVR